MRRSKYLRIIIPFLIWVLIILKLHSMLQHRPTKTERDQYGDPIVTIEYFKRFYVKSHEEESGNRYGRNGEKVKIPDSEKEAHDKAFELYKFNELASSKIPLLRTFPEKRRASCFTRKYPLDLPKASIIIIYRNEAWSTLLRTVHTCLSRSPHYLVNEVILVDDFSELDKFSHLSAKLDSHFENNPKVIIIRPPKRVGLTYARLLGAKKATGDVLIFLDSHCECGNGWLEPLLLDIKENPEVAITPIIEVISLEDFSIHNSVSNVISVGSFTWKADFTWHTPKEQRPTSDIVKSPTMAGGLFAIGKEYFFKMGSYDEKMTYWGGENIEISFRLWMCGGGIFSDPCSIIGHVFRKSSPHNYPAKSVLFNKLRAVEVWMDEYKSIVYSRIGIDSYMQEAGSLQSRMELRKNLGCQSFKWYLENIADFIRVPGKTSSIENPQSNMCLDVVDNSDSGNPIKIFRCHNAGGNQALEVDVRGQIIHDDLCLDLSSSDHGAKPILYTCHFSGGNQAWSYINVENSDGMNKRLIQHTLRNLCLTIDSNIEHVIVQPCDHENLFQHFSIPMVAGPMAPWSIKPLMSEDVMNEAVQNDDNKIFAYCVTDHAPSSDVIIALHDKIRVELIKKRINNN